MSLAIATRIYSPVVRPEDFGAAADGSTDDTTAIQAAIDTGYPVIFRNGYTYNCDELEPPPSGVMTLLAETISKNRHPKLQPPSSGVGNGVILTNHGSSTLNVNISGLYFYDYDIAINLGSSWAGEIEANISGNKITNCARGIWLNNDGLVYATIFDNEITDISSTDDMAVAIGVGRLGGTGDATTGQCFIERNRIENVISSKPATTIESHAVWAEAYNCHVIDNYINTVGSTYAKTLNGGEAIYTISSMGKILHNKIIDGCFGGDGAIVCKGDRGTTGAEGYSVEVAFNTLEQYTKGRFQVGINTQCVYDVYIHDNTLNGLEAYGYFSGTHTAVAGSGTILTDENANYTVDALIDSYIYNVTDGSLAQIIDNDATTIEVAALTGGSDQTFQQNDVYTIIPAAAIGDLTGIYVESAGTAGRNIRVENNNLYDMKTLYGISFKTSGVGHRITGNNVYITGTDIITGSPIKAINIDLAVSGTTNDFRIESNTIEFASTLVTDASIVRGIYWDATTTTHNALRINDNTVILDSQVSSRDAGAVTTTCFDIGDNASQVFNGSRIIGNNAIGSHDNAFGTVPATGTHVNSIIKDNSWNAVGAFSGTWRVLHYAGNLSASDSDQEMDSFTLPGGSMTTNSVIRITAWFDDNDSGGACGINFDFGTASAVVSRNIAGGATDQGMILVGIIKNNASTSSQLVSGNQTYNTPTNNAFTTTASVDTSADCAIAINAQSMTSGEVINVLYWMIEILD